MEAVQQQFALQAVRTGRCGKRAILFHAGVLARQRSSHRESITDVLFFSFRMKAKILKKFEDQVAQLEHELKTELPKEIQRARELGDLRENAEYQAAKDRQTIVNSQLAMLRKRMAEIAIMNMDKIPHDRAAFGSTVHLTEDNGDKIIYQLVMPEEADAAKGLISTSSPIGRAIVGRIEGDEINVVTPNGQRQFEITKLVTIHDEA